MPGDRLWRFRGIKDAMQMEQLLKLGDGCLMARVPRAPRNGRIEAELLHLVGYTLGTASSAPCGTPNVTGAGQGALCWRLCYLDTVHRAHERAAPRHAAKAHL